MDEKREWGAMATVTPAGGFRTERKRSRLGRDKRLMLAGLAILVAVLAVGWAFEGPGSPSAHPSSGVSIPARARVATSASGPDGLSWRIVASYTARRIVNAYLPPARASGIYLIMDVRTTNGSGHTVVLDSRHLSLDLAGARYPLDAAAVSALELAGHRGLSGTGLGPETTTSGWVVFDVPPTAVASTPRLCLAEAGTGRGAEVCRS